MVMRCLLCIVVLSCMGCVSTETRLYEQLGGEAKIAEIVKNFVHEIEYDPTILTYFQGTDIDRFVQQFSEQLCDITGGPCSYRGDSMNNIHRGMQISEKDFNRTVELLITAMNNAAVPQSLQNQILSKLAPMRQYIIE